jgi:hypothetical protein
VLNTIEINHPIIEPLLQKSDHELLALFQGHPDLGQYLVAIFCRYGQIIYTLTRHSGRSPVVADYLFSKAWERIYRELKLLQIENAKTLQNFLIDITGVEINDFKAPENIKYDLSLTPPIFLCYLNQALEQLPKELRLILTLSSNFNWSSSRITAYLRSEGNSLQDLLHQHRVKDIDSMISKANLDLIQLLPQDIQDIYLSEVSRPVTA